ITRRDWSSDVCSSDLSWLKGSRRRGPQNETARTARAREPSEPCLGRKLGRLTASAAWPAAWPERRRLRQAWTPERRPRAAQPGPRPRARQPCRKPAAWPKSPKPPERPEQEE